MSKSAFVKGVGHFKRKFQMEGDIAHQLVMWCQNFSCMFFRFVTKHVCDRQTDRQTYDPHDCASIAASHGKNCQFVEMV